MDKIITIGVPTKNRIFCIDRVLASILSQTHPKGNIKIVFVDESDDGTYERLLQFREKHRDDYLDIRILRSESNGYISAVRNICIKNMEGDVMFFWDSDVMAPDNNALGRVLQSLEGENAAVAGLPYYCENPCLYERIMQAETELGGMGFTAIRREIFNKAGLFNEKLKVNEDTDFLARVRIHGMKVNFEDGTPCLHLRPQMPNYRFRNNFSDYKRRLRWCFNNVPGLYAEMIGAGSRPHLFRVLYYLALPPIIILWLVNFSYPIIPTVLATIFVALYVLFNLSYHIWKASRNRVWGIVAFAYHTPCGIAISYGLVSKFLKDIFEKQ